jgi:hypothetical protein
MTDAEDKESVDRAFAELVAGFHLTADRPEPPREADREPPPPEPGSVFPLPLPLPAPVEQPSTIAEPVDAPDPTRQETYDPGPPPPLPRPAWPVGVGWLGLGYAMLTVLAVAVGVDLPRWAAWAAIIGFVGGFALLVSRLPRERPPDAGDGAVL